MIRPISQGSSEGAEKNRDKPYLGQRGWCFEKCYLPQKKGSDYMWITVIFTLRMHV